MYCVAIISTYEDGLNKCNFPSREFQNKNNKTPENQSNLFLQEWFPQGADSRI